MGGAYGPSGLNIPLPLDQNPFFNMQFIFLATLELPNLSRLTNDPIQHNPSWSTIPVNTPTDIPELDGKTGKDLTTNITMYHPWCLSNSLLDDSICLHLFPCTLIGNASKWFIELKTTSFNNFNALAMAFLTHFQLPIRYETINNYVIMTKQCHSHF